MAGTWAAVAALVMLSMLAEPAPAVPATERNRVRIHPRNPLYVTRDGVHAICLAGLHTWPSIQDMGPTDPPEPFDFDAYLDLLEQHHLVYARLWRWELPRYAYSEGEGAVRYCSPHPWKRTGPGLARDGKPKFDLTAFDDAYFARLRERVEKARKRGIIVSVMLFEGHGVQIAPVGWEYHPFHKDNNVNGVDGDADGDGRGIDIHTLAAPRVTALQEEYVRRVLDAVGDLDNVMYEISNEAGPYSTEWQYHMIRFVKECEKARGRAPLVGMTFQYKGGSNETLFRSPADWVSPNPDGGYRDNPPVPAGKVLVADTDHLWGIGGNVAWVWKSFTRGQHPVYMDPYSRRPPFDGVPDLDVRRNIGYVSAYAQKMALADMSPHGELASSGYCLADPGREYLVYLPEGGAVEVDLSAAAHALSVEWLDPKDERRVTAGTVQGGGRRSLEAPFPGDAVLYLKASG